MVIYYMNFSPYFVARNNFFSSFVFLPSCNSHLQEGFVFYSDPSNTPETFHELKLVPSVGP